MTGMIDQRLKYSVSGEVTVEEFPGAFLVFLARQLRLIEINRTAKMVLDLMDGERTIGEIVHRIASEFDIDENTVGIDVSGILFDMISEGVICPEVKLRINGELNMSENKKFMANPDVSCRIEDEDGAILFNPDSDSTQVINPIGLDIWRSVERHPRFLSEVVAHIKDLYEDAPENEVEKDVEEFVMNLHAKGFVGEVVDE